MILVVSGNFLSAFPPIDSLLSPEDSVASCELSGGSLAKLPSTMLVDSSFSPIKPSDLSLDHKLLMDPDGCPPCVVEHMSPLASRLAPPNRMPPHRCSSYRFQSYLKYISPLRHFAIAVTCSAVKVNTLQRFWPLRTLQSKSLLID